MDTQNSNVLSLIRTSMLPGQEGITVRAFLAFNRDNALATMENLEKLQKEESIVLKNDTIYPVEVL